MANTSDNGLNEQIVRTVQNTDIAPDQQTADASAPAAPAGGSAADQAVQTGKENTPAPESADDKFWPKFKLFLSLLGKWILVNLRLVLPVLIIMAAALAVIGIIMVSRVRTVSEPGEGDTAISEIPDNAIPIPVDAPLELNAYPALNDFFAVYYGAMATGDRDTIVACNPYLSESSLLRMEAISEYVDHYSLVDVYTKPGPVSDSYVCYVYSKVKFIDYIGDVPGMNTMYVCTGDDGRLFINIQNESDEIQNYINGISLLDDVKDLHNRVNVEYNEMIAADDNMTRFMDDLTQQINIKVGTQLAAASGAGIGEEPGESAPASIQQPEPEPVVNIDPDKQVEAREVVNVRAAESVNSAAVGMIAPGTVYELLAELESGWSRIRFEGGEVYVKSEYLRKLADEEDEGDAGTEPESASVDTSGFSEETPGRAIALESIYVRSEASTVSEHVDLAYPGAEMEVIAPEEDGWIKVRYNGNTGYVKVEFLRFE
ncbi:MAG: SH3 domain-containing protein [Lachnospiraceae bacterium]|nr:SH3 domain-containing protein [Lachnospiraceae bacterium]